MSPWVRLDEHALNHAKILALTHGAFRLWVEGLAYCQKHLTDGVIDKSALRGFRYFSARWVEELTTAPAGMSPLWDVEDAAYRVHDYLQWNDSRTHVVEARQRAKDRLQRHRKRVSGDVSNAVRSPVHNHATTTGVPEKQERKQRVFAGQRLRVTQKQLEAVTAELGDRQVDFIDWTRLFERIDARLVETGEPFNTLNVLRDGAEREIKKLRAGGPLYASASRVECPHEPRCNSKDWCALLTEREAAGFVRDPETGQWSQKVAS